MERSKIGRKYRNNFISLIKIKIKYIETQNNADNIGLVISVRISRKDLGKCTKTSSC